MNISDLVSIKSKPHFCNETILFNSARMLFGFADVRMRKHLLPFAHPRALTRLQNMKHRIRSTLSDI